MLVTGDRVEGTIGGGTLEWQAIAAARELLAAPREAPSVVSRRLTLAREAAQCCGGVVQLWMELERNRLRSDEVHECHRSIPMNL